VNEVIYHIAPRTAWEHAQRSGVHQPSSLATEGFIHCSTAAQVAWVAGAFYRDVPDLVLLHIDVAQVESELRYEGEDPGFPHIYGALDTAAVIHVEPYAPGVDGAFPSPSTLKADAAERNQEGVDDAGH
jgi:uncharacterized protein (DUF952 family)